MRELLGVFALLLGYFAASDADALPDGPPPARLPDGRVLVWLVDRAAWVPIDQAPKMTSYYQTPPVAPAIPDGARVLDRLIAEKLRPSLPCYVDPHSALIGSGHVKRIMCGD